MAPSAPIVAIRNNMHGTRSVMQLALRYGFALGLKQLENGSQHGATVATMKERLEKAECKLNSMTPAEQDQMWDKIEVFTKAQL